MEFREAMKLTSGNTIHETGYKNGDGTCARWRVNGKTKLWKTRPKEFRIPIKRGLREYFNLDHDNLELFHSIARCDNAEEF